MGDDMSQEDIAIAKKRQIVNNLILNIFQAVLIHVCALQSDITLFSRYFQGNASATSRALTWSNAIAGISGILVNQMGGKLSDAFGRKRFFLLGPLANIVCAMALIRHSSSLVVLYVSRVLKSVLTTFSGTVMSAAAIADISTGLESAFISTRLQVAVGIAVVAGPYLESVALKWSRGNPLAPFKVMIALSMCQILNISMLPETLSKRRSLTTFGQTLASLNPFAFMQVYLGENRILKKLMTITALQSCVDGKVTSDLFQLWQKNNLKWSPEMARDFIAFWGAAVTCGSSFVHPYLLKRLSTYTYSTVGNLFVGTGLVIHGLAEKGICMWGGVPFLLPGVNGGSAHAIKALIVQIARKEGYGNGEIAAWSNNLRTISQSLQIVLLGRWYAQCTERRIYAGTSWFVAAFVGGFLPQLLIMTVPRSDFETGK